MINDDEFIALFNSPTRVLKAEKALRKAGLACRLIPAPRDVAEGCALALRFAAAELPSILFELGRQDLLPRRMYQKHAGLFTSIPVSPEP
ncbi:MAG: DUF3343 domain-containing protein [Pedobacter sp.]